MTIPNVCMVWCQRTAKCQFCEQVIVAGTPQVKAFYWNKGTPEHKGFNNTQYYHPQCWVLQGLYYLEHNPYVPYTRNIGDDKLTAEQKAQRRVLLHHKSALDQRLRNLKSTGEKRIFHTLHISEEIGKIMEKILPLGGIPQKWIDEL